MRKLLLSFAALLGLAAPALADYKIIILQEPIQQWAEALRPEWEAKLGEKIVLDYQPGAWSLPGILKFQNKERFDDSTMLSLVNASGEAYLTMNSPWDFHDWQPIGLQEYTNFVIYKQGVDPFKDHIKMRYGVGPGSNADILAAALMACGPKASATIEDFKRCYDERITYVKGMSGPEGNMAYERSELNVHSGGFAGYLQLFKPNPQNVLWFMHDMVDIKTGKDYNPTGYPTFNEVYKQHWGVAPSGDIYEAYRLLRSYRDVLQKSVFVNKGNKNADKLIKALQDTINDPAAMARLLPKNGDLPYFIGKDVDVAIQRLDGLTSEKSLKDLQALENRVLGFDAVYKPELVKKK
jgi:hypothetical protein